MTGWRSESRLKKAPSTEIEYYNKALVLKNEAGKKRVCPGTS